jgi:ethanolamine utilization protein EutN
MILGRVIGDVTASVKHPGYEGHKILVVKPVKPGGEPSGRAILAIDHVQAGPGDTVLVIDEGGSAIAMLGDTKGAIRTVIAGIVDEVSHNV